MGPVVSTVSTILKSDLNIKYLPQERKAFVHSACSAAFECLYLRIEDRLNTYEDKNYDAQGIHDRRGQRRTATVGRNPPTNRG